MSIPRPKVPFLIIKGTQKVLSVDYGDNIMSSGTRVYTVTNVANNCSSNPTPDTYELQDLDGVDVGEAVIDSNYQIQW
jgi:hypothetical protein